MPTKNLPMSIDVTYLTREQLNEFAKAGSNSLLCLIGYDAPCPDWVPMGLPFSQVEIKPLTNTAYEVWTATGKIRYDAARRFAVARAPGAIMALVKPDQLGSQSLGDVAREAYGRIFDITDGAEQSLMRIWNYIPYITEEEEDGLERYRSFNKGRAEAFDEAPGAPAIPPAASGLGTSDGDLLIYFLAGDGTSTAIENPRQVSAYNYPEDYGPRSPSFSRATLAKIGLDQMLFISGTASIVGHESQHIGDVEAQARETITNVRAVLAEAKAKGFNFNATRARFKIYLRDAEHFDLVRPIVEAEFPDLGGALYLNAEICRKDLLVEIEAACLAR